MRRPAIVCGYLPGCIGRVAELHAAYYSAHAGFGVYFEAKVAREFAAFCEGYDAARDGMWFAELDGRVEASIVIDASHADRDGAHLRWFIAADAVRGQGIGEHLLAEALAFCDARSYAQTYLWTFEGLHAARHLYEKHGFRLSKASPGRQWGTPVNEQRYLREKA